jgi:molybdopterin converting factor small subunit
MHVTVRGIGDLKDYLGKGPWEVDLAEGACARDLLQQIEERWGANFPPYLWDSGQHQFRGPVFLVVNRKVLQDMDAPLQDGMEVRIMRAIAGG